MTKPKNSDSSEDVLHVAGCQRRVFYSSLRCPKLGDAHAEKEITEQRAPPQQHGQRREKKGDEEGEPEFHLV